MRQDLILIYTGLKANKQNSRYTLTFKKELTMEALNVFDKELVELGLFTLREIEKRLGVVQEYKWNVTDSTKAWHDDFKYDKGCKVELTARVEGNILKNVNIRRQ